jgi:hypothetical protein
MNRHRWGHAAPMHSVGTWMPLVVIGAAVIAAAGFAVLYGPAARERAEQLKAEEIDREDRMLCARLGMAHGSDGFGACARVLLEARRLHEERIAVEAAGIL